MIRRVLVPVLVVVFADAVMLWSAAANRAAPPDAQVTVSSRDLAPIPSSSRSSAREVRWKVDRPIAVGGEALRWMDARKMSALGFDSRPAERQLSRRVFAVVDAHGSPLRVVDAAVDAEALRGVYPDRGRYIVVPAVVSANGFVRSVLLSDLLVPREFAHLVDRPYTVTVAFGHHHEPWIVAIDPVDTPPVRQ